MTGKMCAVLSGIVLLLSGCKDQWGGTIRFGTSADCPPFEYCEDGEIKGFDVDLARMVAKEMGKKAEFENMEFNAALDALDGDSIQAVISTVTSTPERRKKYDLSRCYYAENIATVYNDNEPYKTVASLSRNVNVACTRGTTTELWVKQHAPDANLILMDKNSVMIDALKADQIDCIVLDSEKAKSFCANNSGLSYSIVDQTDEGYVIAFKKQSPLKNEANAAIGKLQKNGELEKLKAKWRL